MIEPKVYKDGQGAKMAFFGKNIGVKNELRQSEEPLQRNSGNDIKIANMAYLKDILADEGVYQFRMKKDKEYSGVNLDFTSYKVIGSSSTEYKVVLQKVEKQQDDEFKELKAKKLLAKSEVSEPKLEANRFKAAIKFVATAEELEKQKGSYRVKFALLPQNDKYSESMGASFASWNFTENEFTSGSKIQAWGNKTLNIVNFVANLAKLNMRLNEPGFYNLYVYLEVK